MSGKSLGINLELTHSTAQHALGLIVVDPRDGKSKYMYVRADDAITQYDAVTYDFAAAGSGTAADVPHLVTRTSAVDQALVGVAQVAIAAGDYGFVLVEGVGIVQAETAVAQGDFLGTSAVAGELITEGIPDASSNQALAAGRAAVALEAEGATTAGFASVFVQ